MSLPDYDEIPFEMDEIEPPSYAGDPTEHKHTHKFFRVVYMRGEMSETVHECRCGRVRDEAHARRGRQSRNYGNRAELAASRKYGGDKIGAAGGPVDIRGKEWNVQVKTHRRLPPAEWRKAFQAMAASRERHPRLLLRFLPGPGLPPDDYFVIPGHVWLDWFGRDE